MIKDEIKKLNEQYSIVKIFKCEEYFDDQLNLYIDLKSIKKDAFGVDERIIFVLESDFYANDSRYPSGQILTLIQKFCNDIDISNPFITVITSNENIIEEYNWVFKNENFDDNKFNIIVSSGDFFRYPYNNKLVFHRQENYADLANKLVDEDPKIKNIVQNNKSFCSLAWNGINIEPDGRIRICCESEEILGDLSKNTIKDIWNSEKLKNIRSSMISGKPVKSCQSCYTKENYGRDSLRKSSNRKFTHVIKNIIDNTDSHGYYNKFNLKYLDTRYNNLCNLACRSCGSHASTSWYKANIFLDDEFAKKQPSAFLVAGNSEDDVYNQVIEHIDTIETIYFAGGEPLIIEKFYDLLELLIKNQKFDTELIYNTNMTKTKLKSRKIFDLWKKFSNVSVGASLDAQDKRAEYIRTNTKWEEVEKNRKLMMQECPHIDFYVSATTSILNALHVPDFHYSWVKKGLIKPEEFNIQILFTPNYFSLSQAPKELKKLVEKKYVDHLKWLRPIDKNGRATFGYESILEHMKSNEEFNKKDFWYKTDLLDRFYNQNILDYIPELSILPR